MQWIPKTRTLKISRKWSVKIWVCIISQNTLIVVWSLWPNYLWNSKRIPEELPLDLMKTEKPFPENFEPAEANCPPELNNAFVKHKQQFMGYFRRTKVEAFCKIFTLKSTYINCAYLNVCSKLSTYKNINNICLKTFLFYSLHNHIAVGRILRTIESHSGTTVPQNALRKSLSFLLMLWTPPICLSWLTQTGKLPLNCQVRVDLKFFLKLLPFFFSQLSVHLLICPEKHGNTSQETEVNVATRWENLRAVSWKMLKKSRN